ncbi:MAG: VCBS repeat-containing protein, partial [Chloroflexota bacterium]|nr:VCBS repeat-containing protein [Chloroflexota bacterium]
MPHQNPLSSSDGFLLKVCLLAVALVILSATLNVPGAFEQTDMALAQNEQVTFTNVTISAGVNNSTTPQWGGVWGDYNGDGYQDLYAGNHFDTPHLYLNNSDGTFTDVQPQDVGIKSGPDDWHSAAWGDYNNDGHLDLYVVVGKAQDGSDFYINNGDGTFTENALAAGVKNQDGRGRTPQWVDYDNDGDLDIFISNHTDIEAPHVLYRNNNDGTFTDVADQAGVALSLGAEGVAWADYDNDGWMDFILSKTGDSSTRGYNLFHNQKDGTFNDVSNDVGLSFAGQYPQTAAWGDYDNDGDLDLFLGRSYFPFKDNLISTTDVITVFAQVSQGQEGLTFNTSSSDATFDLWRIDQILKTNEIELGAGNTFPTTVPFTLDNTTNIHIGQPAYTPGEGDEERVFVWRDTQGDPWNIYWNSPTSSFRSFYTVSIIKTDGTFTDVISDGLD